MFKKSWIFAAAAIVSLSACLDTPDLRNAAVGAAVGCVAGEAIAGGNCATGAAVGAAGGALINDL